MKKAWTAAGCLMAVGWLASAIMIPSPVAGEGLVPFGHGERLVYELSWYNLIGGTATLEVQEADHTGIPTFHVRSVAKSNEFVSLFFPVEDRIESLIDRDGLYPLRLDVHQLEGKRRRERVTEFDQVKHTATVTKQGERRVFAVPPAVQDSLSALYYFRSLPPIRVGQTVTIDVHESSKNWRLAIVGLNRETVTTPAGTFQTVRVGAHVEFEGVFLDRGEVFIWFTDDARRVPVQMRSKIKIGKITARLVEFELARPPEVSLGASHE